MAHRTFVLVVTAGADDAHHALPFLAEAESRCRQAGFHVSFFTEEGEPKGAHTAPSDSGVSKDEIEKIREYAFAGIDFASDVAYELARDENLSAEDFEGHSGNGSDGAYLKSDVEAVLAEREEEEEEDAEEEGDTEEE